MSNLLSAVQAINDALSMINALQPLVTMATRDGRDITDDELAFAVGRAHAGIDKLDETIRNT